MIPGILMVVGVTAGALGLGAWGVRFARSTSNLYVASRAVSPWLNAAAISGEYLSAASFLGIAGLAMKVGMSALWLSLGFTAGYLALLLFVAAPLRRFGSYTIPDFAEARLGSGGLRLLAAAVVVLICGFYLVPQLKGAGIALSDVTGSPYWVGVVAVALLVALVVGAGGMRGITYVQAYQFWVKTFAIAVPACVLLIHFGGLPARAAMFGHELPHAPRAGLTVRMDRSQTVEFPRATAYRLDGAPRHAAAGQQVRLASGAVLRLPAGAPVPVAEGTTAKAGGEWARPVAPGRGTSSLYIYSLLIATVLGTMGLPHILVRFYTNPDGVASRRTTVRVLGLLGVFYLFPMVYGMLGRVLAPALYVTGDTDSVVLKLPQAALPGLAGDVLGGLTAAGAFAAFMSTSSGLLVSIAGTVSHDVWGRVRRRTEGPSPGRRRFRAAAVPGMLAPALLALAARNLEISLLVGWAFALAASTFCPLFLLGIWWSGLTARGAAAGMVVGATIGTGGIFAGLALPGAGGPLGALLSQPAVVSVPLAFATMVCASLLDRRQVPEGVEAQMLALHAPEGLGVEELPRDRLPAYG